MSQVEHIEGQVKSLSLDEVKDFRDWFARYDAEVWDDPIEADSKLCFNAPLCRLSVGTRAS
jgi:hypothetical protein